VLLAFHLGLSFSTFEERKFYSICGESSVLLSPERRRPGRHWPDPHQRQWLSGDPDHL